MRRTLICIVITMSVAAVAVASQVELTLYPAKAADPTHKYAFLPRSNDQTDADAMPLYEKALQALPEDFSTENIERWLKTPPDELPRKAVESTLQQFKPVLDLLEQAAKCKQCDWPYLDDEELSANMRRHRRLVFFLALQARFQIAQSQYDKAVETMRAGLVMAKHLGEAPTLMHRLFGIGIAAHTCRQIEQFIQGSDAPSLYQALQELPQPYIDLTEQAEWLDQDAAEKVHLLMKRLDRHLAALQCIEAMRLYAASNSGRFPDRLKDVTDITFPHDPVTLKTFIYRRTDSGAVLEMQALKGATNKDVTRYKLTLKE